MQACGNFLGFFWISFRYPQLSLLEKCGFTVTFVQTRTHQHSSYSLKETPHLTESQKCETLYNHLSSGWEANDWYEELESSAPEVLTSWSMLHNHFHVKWLGASPSTLLEIPKCNPSIINTATIISHESATNQAQRATSNSTKREEGGKGEEEEERVRNERDSNKW